MAFEIEATAALGHKAGLSVQMKRFGCYDRPTDTQHGNNPYRYIHLSHHRPQLSEVFGRGRTVSNVRYLKLMYQPPLTLIVWPVM